MDCYFQDIEHHIINQINLAENRLLLAVAWFTNETIGNHIIKKKGIDIEIIVDDNKENYNCKNLLKLKSENIDLVFVKDLNKNYYLMHNKFCVIDNKCVITGSYNWTKNANTNDENISVIYNKTTAALYTQEFRRIKNIKFPNENISITDIEANEITALIYAGLVKALKENISKGELKKGLIYDWSDVKIQNKIRVIDERVRNTLHQKVGNYGIYFDLISKYGFEYKSFATEKEKVLARDDFNKNGLDNVESDINNQLIFFKIKAIKKLQNEYIKLMDFSKDDYDIINKVTKVFVFLNNEKIALAENINLNMI